MSGIGREDQGDEFSNNLFSDLGQYRMRYIFFYLGSCAPPSPSDSPIPLRWELSDYSSNDRRAVILKPHFSPSSASELQHNTCDIAQNRLRIWFLHVARWEFWLQLQLQFGLGGIEVWRRWLGGRKSPKQLLRLSWSGKYGFLNIGTNIPNRSTRDPTVTQSYLAHGSTNSCQLLYSSTSSDICELWNGTGIVRVVGQPDILELVIYESVYSIHAITNLEALSWSLNLDNIIESKDVAPKGGNGTKTSQRIHTNEIDKEHSVNIYTRENGLQIASDVCGLSYSIDCTHIIEWR